MLNGTRRSTAPQPSYMQWITGDSRVDVDFGRATVALALAGRHDLPGRPDRIERIAGLSRRHDLHGVGPGDDRPHPLGGLHQHIRQRGLSSAAPPRHRRSTSAPSRPGRARRASSFDGGFFGPNAVNQPGLPHRRRRRRTSGSTSGAFTGGKRLRS
ncbi:hypothetical protein AB5I41_23415 [Sphingomonas sp. MMS24-JH45]